MKKLSFKLCLALCMFGSACTDQTDTTSPNILIILTDDQGYGDISINGNPEVDTPNMDAFAGKSVRLHDFHSQPVCAPSRAQLMTGRHALTAGVWGVHGGRDYLNLDELTIAEVLQENGYDTYMLGKWHLGKEDPYLPEYRGFDEAWVQANLYQHQNPIIKNKGEELAPKAWTVDYLTDTALEVFGRESENPKFMYLAYPQIHKPYVAPDSLIQKYIDRGHSRALASIYGITEQLDQNIGRLFEELKSTGELDNTVVFFLGDNGPIWNNAPKNQKGVPVLPEEESARNPLNLAGVKGRLHENGHRTIGFVKYGDNYEARDEYQMIDIADIFPTIIDLLDIQLSDSTKPLLGESILPILRGETQNREMAYYYANHEVLWKDRPYSMAFVEDKFSLKFEDQELAIRKGNFKYIQGYFGKKLFDLENDLQETIDLSGELPKTREELEGDLKKWWEEEVLKNSNSYDMPIFHLGVGGNDSTFVHGSAPTKVFGEIITGDHNSKNWIKNGDGVSYRFIVESFGVFEFMPKWELGDNDAELEIAIGTQSDSYKLSEMAKYKLPLTTQPLEPGEYEIIFKLKNSKSKTIPAIEVFHGIMVTGKR